MIVYEAFMRCGYCGTRMVQKLGPDEVARLSQRQVPTRHCEFCGGPTEWHLLEWRGNRPPALQAENAEPAERLPERILVIDDDDLTTVLLRKVLDNDNCVMEVASDGREALQKIMENRYSLIICDLHMPNMDGKKLYQFVDEQALESKNTILFITGDTSGETRKFLEGTGCSYVHKPIQILEFAARVREILGS